MVLLQRCYFLSKNPNLTAELPKKPNKTKSSEKVFWVGTNMASQTIDSAGEVPFFCLKTKIWLQRSQKNIIKTQFSKKVFWVGTNMASQIIDSAGEVPIFCLKTKIWLQRSQKNPIKPNSQRKSFGSVAQRLCLRIEFHLVFLGPLQPNFCF